MTWPAAGAGAVTRLIKYTPASDRVCCTEVAAVEGGTELMSTISELYGSLRGRRVLVTGSSRGIGARIAEAFGEYGAVVGVHYNRSAEQAADVAWAVEENGGTAVVLQADLLQREARQSLVKKFVTAVGGIDVLVNNAGGLNRYASFMDLTEDDWDAAMDLHAKAPLQLSAAACRYMEAAGFGRIINISTTAIKYTGANSAHYTASKAAMETIASTIGKWGASRKILVNTIRCGVVETEMRHRIAGYSEEAYRSRVSLVPVGRPGTTDEVAALTTFLASDAGAFVTREIWTIAGGD